MTEGHHTTVCQKKPLWYDTAYMGIKNFLMKKLIGAKLKHLPKDQQEMILALVSENPEFFKKIQSQIEAKKKQGQNEQLAMMQVMRENQAEIQKLMMQYAQKNK
jgi:hypothetical protein